MKGSTTILATVTHTTIGQTPLRLKKTINWTNKVANKSQKTQRTWPIKKKSKYYLAKLNSALLIRDYRAMPELDAYEQEGIDNAPQAEANIVQRREAERQLNQMERAQIVGKGRQAAALMDDDESGEEDEEARMIR